MGSSVGKPEGGPAGVSFRTYRAVGTGLRAGLLPFFLAAVAAVPPGRPLPKEIVEASGERRADLLNEYALSQVYAR